MSVEKRLKQFCLENNLTVLERIGFGIHGEAFAVLEMEIGVLSVCKVLEETRPFGRELAVYQRLSKQAITEIEGFSVPRLLGSDAELRVIWMTLVVRPFCLDFASAYLAYLDKLPDGFPPFHLLMAIS